MCGISGALSFSGGGERFRGPVEKMVACQHNRGPDDTGFDHSGPVFFGHNRLSIIDLSAAGHQPMRRGKLLLTFNGEIYNFRELKKGLEEAGAAFGSDSDTEVLLALFEREGEAGFAKLRGMFAFGLWDEEKETLYLVRDRFGIKPLYYAEKDGALAFASTVTAIAESGIVPCTKNPDAMLLFLMFGSIPLPMTTYREVSALPSGTYLKIAKTGKELVRYYSTLPDFESPYEKAQAYIGRTRAVLEDSVRAHLISDAPAGIFLSGGLDSSALAALAKAGGAGTVTTLSVDFDEPEFSEGAYQRLVAKRIGSTHRETKLTKEDFFASLPDALAHMDQPTVDGLNTYFVSQAARSAGLTVVLSGVGGDELFLGYRHFRRAETVAFFEKVLGRELLAFLGGKFAKFEFLKAGGILGGYLAVRGIYPPGEAAAIAGRSREEALRLVKELEETVFGDDGARIRALAPAVRFSYLDFTLYMQNQLLKDSDVMAMRHSIEVRVPFVDAEVAAHVAKIHPARRLSGTHNKQVLIDAVKDLLPEEIYARPKMGFTFPFQKWLAGEGSPIPPGEISGAHWSRDWARYVWKKFS